VRKRYDIGFLIICLIFLSILSFSSVKKVHSAVEVDFILENIFWGTPPDNVITANPGDTNVPLTITIRNHSNETLRGVIGYLYLVYPFTDYLTESNVSKASAQPVEQGDVFNQTGDILPSGSFTFTFRLNIHPNATKGVYKCNLTIHYTVKQGSFFIEGTPQTLEVAIRIYNRAPVIYSVNPTSATISIAVGEYVNFSCKAGDPDDDNITYKWIFDGETVGFGQNYTYYAREKDLGSHTLTVEVSDGNLTASNSWALNVIRTPITSISVSDQYIFGGYDNEIQINITNNIWVGTVRVVINVPQYLVLIGNNTWIFKNISKGEMISIDITIYSPESLIGQTMQITLSVSYSDEFGTSYNENYAIGLVIRGKVVLKVYEVIVSPYIAHPGDKISISGTLLNMGNVAAMFTNVSIEANEILDLTYESFAYIGDVDPNSPVPFTLTAYIKSNANNGTYTIVVNVHYKDDLRQDHYLSFKVYVTIEKEIQSTEENKKKNALDFIISGGWSIIGLIAAVIVIGVFYFRRRGES